jgi:uncharacterized membrane protein YphA (DoxX/SURF4 family)
MPVISSTLLLTILIMIGLLFFIRGSVKDRTEQAKLLTAEKEDSLLPKLNQYFRQRAYKVVSVDADLNRVTFEGFVRPSWFLAIFLTILAAIGLLSLGLVLSFLYPPEGNLFLGLVVFAPVAGVFYWQGAGRLEKVLLQVETVKQGENQGQSLLTVTAHRDELRQLKQILSLTNS